MTERPISVLLVDDHAVVRSGCRRALEMEPDIRVAAEATTGDEAYRLYSEVRPDVVLMDLSLPGSDGLDVVRRILARDRQARILIFTIHDNDVLAERALQAGALGFLTKTADLETVCDAVRRVATRAVSIDRRLATRLALRAARGEASVLSRLTARQFEIFRLVAGGAPTAEVADALHLAPKTVANHVAEIKSKLGVASTAELARLALQHGVVDI